jgi:hypothetical protein
MCADIRDGQEQKPLHSRAGYRSARPTISRASYPACNARPVHTKVPTPEVGLSCFKECCEFREWRPPASLVVGGRPATGMCQTSGACGHVRLMRLGRVLLRTLAARTRAPVATKGLAWPWHLSRRASQSSSSRYGRLQSAGPAISASARAASRPPGPRVPAASRGPERARHPRYCRFRVRHARWRRYAPAPQLVDH